LLPLDPAFCNAGQETTKFANMISAEQIQYLQQRIAHYDDQQAYKLLFTALYPYLYPFARALVKTKEPAEEIVSDVFIKIWEKRKGLNEIGNLKLYLYVATRNCAYNYLENQQRTVTRPAAEFSEDIPSMYFDPEQLMITADMLAMIQRAINELPPKCKIIFKLTKEDGLKYREVAEILNISVKTVENQLAIALHKIGAAVHFDIQKTVPSSHRHPH
jgi:RNA polymerase sigma-70 factor (ECF subfamily)